MSRLTVEEKCNLIRQMKEEQRENQMIVEESPVFDHSYVGGLKLRFFLSVLLFLMFYICYNQNTVIEGYDMEMISNYIGTSQMNIEEWIENEKISFR